MLLLPVAHMSMRIYYNVTMVKLYERVSFFCAALCDPDRATRLVFHVEGKMNNSHL